MTLIEIMIVVVLLALVATGLSLGFNALHRTKLRSSALDVVAAARFAYHRAVTKGKTVRVVLDLDAHTIAVEEAAGHVMIQADSEDSDSEEDRSAVDPWAAARARLDDAYGANLGRAAFEPIRNSDDEPLERYQAHQFPVSRSSRVAREEGEAPDTGSPAVRVVRLATPHERDPRETGRGSIYFFPGGRAEHAIVWLSDDEGETVYSVEIHPLTGHGKIYAYAYEPEAMLDEDEVRDPG